MLPCDFCDDKFKSGQSLRRHKYEQHGERIRFSCRMCPAQFARRYTLNQHEKICGRVKEIRLYKCQYCKRSFQLKQYRQHMSRELLKMRRRKRLAGIPPIPRRTAALEPFQCQFCPSSVFKTRDELLLHSEKHFSNLSYKLGKSAFSRVCDVYIKNFSDPTTAHGSLKLFFLREMRELFHLIRNYSVVNRRFRYAMILFVVLSKVDNALQKPIELKLPLRTQQRFGGFGGGEDILGALKFFEIVLTEKADQLCEEEGSGWTFEYVECAHVEFVSAQPLSGGSSHCIKKDLLGHQYLSMPTCPGEMCFVYSIADAFIPSSSTDIERYDFIRQRMNTESLTYPTSIQQIDKFEKNNRRLLNVCISVIICEGKSLIPIRVGKKFNSKTKSVNLLLIHYGCKGSTENGAGANVVDDVEMLGEDESTVYEGDCENDMTDLLQPKFPTSKHHFCRITDLNRLVNVYTRKNGAGAGRYACTNCLNLFWSTKALKNHRRDCLTHGVQKTVFPPVGEEIKFSKPETTHPIHIFGVFDFETKMVKSETNRFDNTQTVPVNEQRVVAYSIAFFDRDKNVIFEETQSSEENCISMFLDTLDRLEPLFMKKFYSDTVVNMTDEDTAQFDAALLCYMCEEPFSEINPKVLDHDHMTGEFIGAAHNTCNMRRIGQRLIPLAAHNWSGFDSHFIIKGIAKHGKVRKMTAMAHSTEKLRNLTLGCYRFVDSMDFINSSLRRMVEDLRDSGHNFPLLSDGTDPIDCGSSVKKNLLLEKGVFPYEHLTQLTKFEEMTEFPAISAFDSVLTGPISLEAYNHGKSVYEVFELNNMREYLHLYNRLDVLLLAEGLIAFREITLLHFKLDMFQYISLPQFAWECMLKYTGVKIGLISDPDMHLFIERGIRGGLSYADTRHTVATPSKHIIYLDVVNLVSFTQFN